MFSMDSFDIEQEDALIERDIALMIEDNKKWEALLNAVLSV